MVGGRWRMPSGQTPLKIKLSDEERTELERLAGSQKAQHRYVVRAKTILLLSQKPNVSAVARAVGRQRRIVRKWANRFIAKRLKGLHDLPRSGRPALFSPRGSGVSGQARL